MRGQWYCLPSVYPRTAESQTLSDKSRDPTTSDLAPHHTTGLALNDPSELSQEG